MTDIGKAIKAINPSAAVVVENDDVKRITWLDGTTPIPEDDIIAKLNIIFRIGFNFPLQDSHVVVYQYLVVFKLQSDLVLAGLNLLQA